MLLGEAMYCFIFCLSIFTRQLLIIYDAGRRRFQVLFVAQVTTKDQATAGQAAVRVLLGVLGH